MKKNNIIIIVGVLLLISTVIAAGDSVLKQYLDDKGKLVYEVDDSDDMTFILHESMLASDLIPLAIYEIKLKEDKLIEVIK